MTLLSWESQLKRTLRLVRLLRCADEIDPKWRIELKVLPRDLTGDASVVPILNGRVGAISHHEVVDVVRRAYWLGLEHGKTQARGPTGSMPPDPIDLAVEGSLARPEAPSDKGCSKAFVLRAGCAGVENGRSGSALPKSHVLDAPQGD